MCNTVTGNNNNNIAVSSSSLSNPSNLGFQTPPAKLSTTLQGQVKGSTSEFAHLQQQLDQLQSKSGNRTPSQSLTTGLGLLNRGNQSLGLSFVGRAVGKDGKRSQSLVTANHGSQPATPLIGMSKGQSIVDNGMPKSTLLSIAQTPTQQNPG